MFAKEKTLSQTFARFQLGIVLLCENTGTGAKSKKAKKRRDCAGSGAEQHQCHYVGVSPIMSLMTDLITKKKDIANNERNSLIQNSK
ncbi:hypothetical protein TNCV_3964271 [Trichonephila clavipes]|nr:hypothetical protein TNCV_3964271 [Trichonephila clavipes]